jgi:hypothetical protein
MTLRQIFFGERSTVSAVAVAQLPQALLFPRAIGYSAGLIDYFFRGKIDSTPWPSGYVLVPWSERPTSIRVENVAVKADETNEQGGQGTMRLVLLYSYRHAGTPEGAPEGVVSHPVSVSASSSPQTVVFPFDSLPFLSGFELIRFLTSCFH